MISLSNSLQSPSRVIFQGKKEEMLEGLWKPSVLLGELKYCVVSIQEQQIQTGDHYTMNEIIAIRNIQINDQQVPSVDARELHRGLEVGRDFSSWVKDQITRAMLIEGVDFEVYPEIGENPSGGRPSIEYYLTLDAAKHICMMSQCPQGLAIRKYFIEVEKRYRAKPTAESPEELMARALIQAQNVIEQKNKVIEEMEPKAEAYDAFISTDDSMSLSECAKLIGIGVRKFNECRRRRKLLFKRGKYNYPVQKYVDRR